MKLGDAVPVIRQAVSARQAAAALGISPDRYGRCACPIHGGKDRNLKLYDGDRGYYCFVCHSGGDVMDLVRNVTGCGLKEAADWLDGAFGLRLNIGEADRPDRTEAARRKVRQRKVQRQAEEDSMLALDEARADCLAAEMLADEIIESCRPRKYGDGFSEAFCAGLRMREDCGRMRDELDGMAFGQWERTK